MSKFYGTRRVRALRVNGRKDFTILYVDKDWGFVAGDVVHVTLRKLDDPEEKILHVIKRLQMSGNSYRFTLDREWGFEPDEWVVYTIEGEEDYNARIGPQEAN